MALKDALIFTPYPEDELEDKFKQWFREVLSEEEPENIPAPTPEEKPLTITEVCDFFGKSRQTIYDWIGKGYLKYYKVSNRTYFLRSDLMETLKEGRVER